MALSNGRHLAFPFRIGGDGRSDQAACDRGDVEAVERGRDLTPDVGRDDRLVWLLVDVGHGRVAQVVDRSVVVPLAQAAHEDTGSVQAANDCCTTSSSRSASPIVAAALGS